MDNGQHPQIEEKAGETEHPEGDQPPEGLETAVEDELAFSTMPSKQLQLGINIVLNADNSSQLLLSHDNTCTRDNDLPLMDHLVPDSSNLVNLDAPACKRLISRTFSPPEVISIIEAIFMSKDEVKMIRNLCGDDAQNFIDVMHEVRPAIFHFSGAV